MECNNDGFRTIVLESNAMIRQRLIVMMEPEAAVAAVAAAMTAIPERLTSRRGVKSQQTSLNRVIQKMPISTAFQVWVYWVCCGSQASGNLPMEPRRHRISERKKAAG